MTSLEDDDFPGIEALHDGLQARIVDVRIEAFRMHADQLVARVAQTRAGLAVHVEDRAVFVVEEESVRRVVHQRAEARFAFLQPAEHEQIRERVGEPPPDLLEQPLLLLRPRSRMRALMQAEQVRLIDLGIERHKHERPDLVRLHQ